MSNFKIVLLCILLFSGFTEKRAKTGWISFDEAARLSRTERRPILIDLYTDWCGWSKQMDKKTYSNMHVADYLQKKFYAIRLNAETRENIQWKEHLYKYNSRYGVNELSLLLSGGKLSFPTSIIIPAGSMDPIAIPGYLEPKDFEALLTYFGDGSSEKIGFEEYEKNFKSSW